MSLEVTVLPPVHFTEQAAKRVYELIQEESDPTLKLRVYIEGGGCSGFQYGFTFDDITNEDDTVVTREIVSDKADPDQQSTEKISVQLLIDPLSLQYLANADIDYIDDVEGERFVIRNPNASTTCGCGSSFSV
jgi:iron-sulfur cluster insertion protein